MYFSGKRNGGSRVKLSKKRKKNEKQNDVSMNVVTSSRDTARVIYNRVPKSGSTTLWSLFARLATHNDFSFVHSRSYIHKILNQTEQRTVVTQVNDVTSRVHSARWLYERHLYFTDFSKFGFPNPIYINLVRDPVDRFASAFYFEWSPQMRNMPHWHEETRNLVSPSHNK